MSPEEAARADLYALLARLFYAPPDENLLSELLQARGFDDEGAPRTERGEALAAAWRGMIEAARTAFPVMLENEHMELFVGTGKSEVSPYLLKYVMRHESDVPLVDLRAALARFGLGRRPEVGEPEDHIAGICETMRILIAVQQRPLEEQKRFFDRFVYAGASAFCNAVSASDKARFYRHVARFAQAFLELEREAFEIE